MSLGFMHSLLLLSSAHCSFLHVLVEVVVAVNYYFQQIYLRLKDFHPTSETPFFVSRRMSTTTCNPAHPKMRGRVNSTVCGLLLLFMLPLLLVSYAILPFHQLFCTMSQPCFRVSRRKQRKQNVRPNSSVDFSNLSTMDASNYLAMVSEQANSMPEVFVAADSPTEGCRSRDNIEDSTNQELVSPLSGRKPYHPDAAIFGSAASLSYLVSSRASLTAPPSNDHLPRNSIWIEKTIANFERLRHYLDRCKAGGVGGKQNCRAPVPPMKDRRGWHVFCVGEDEASGNVGSNYDDYVDKDTNGSLGIDANVQVPNWRQSVPKNGHLPLIPLLLQMDQVMVRRVLSHLTHYVREGWSSVSVQRSAWIYSLLARLEKPIHRDDAAVLFGLLKVLTRVRATVRVVDEDRSDLARLNVMIVLITIYFEQGETHIMKRRNSWR